MRGLGILLLVFSFLHLRAQEATVGVAGSYGSHLEQAGLNLSAGFFISEKVAVEFAYTRFFTKEWFVQQFRFSASSWIIDTEGIFYVSPPSQMVSVFVLAGLNLTSYNGDILLTNPVFATTISESKLGFQFGAGADFGKDDFIPFIEAKYQTGKFEQWVGNAGVKIRL